MIVRPRRWAVLLLPVMVAAGLVSTPSMVQKAYAHGLYATSESGDYTVTATDGTKLKARVVKPTTGTNHPVVMFLHWTGGDRCDSIDSIARSTIAAWGFIVVSFNSRGMPSALNAPGCGDELTSAKDGLNDSGYDWGSNDKQDISDVLTWAGNGCSTFCNGIVDGSKAAAIGFSYGGIRSWLPAFAPVDSRIKAIIPMGDGTPYYDVPAISNRPLEQNGFAPNLQWLNAHMGYVNHSDPRLFQAFLEDSRTRYLNKANGAGSMSFDSFTLTTSGATAFSPADVGQTITVPGAGASGGTLATTIASYSSPTQVTLANKALTAASNVEVTWSQALPSMNPAGTMSASSSTLSIGSNGPQFTAADVGQPITVEGAGASDATLTTTISGYTSATQVTLATPATTGVSSKRVSWGMRAYLDARTLVDGHDAVNKAKTITTPTLMINGFLDGASDVGTRMAVEAWRQIPSTTPKYLYLGACGHQTPSCHSSNADDIQGYIHRFLDRHVRGETGVNVPATGTSVCSPSTRCVFYRFPPKHVLNGSTWSINHATDWGTPQEAANWPPGTAAPYSGEVKLYLRNVSGTTYLEDDPTGWSSADPDKSITNSRMGSPIVPLCTGISYLESEGEVATYDSGVFDSGASPDYKLANFEMNLNMKTTNTNRMQVYVDLFEVKSSGAEVRVWAGEAVRVPTARNVAPGSKVNFRFAPGDAGMTIADGSKLRIRVASNYRRYFAQEPLLDTYKIVHDPYNAGNESQASWIQFTSFG